MTSNVVCLFEFVCDLKWQDLQETGNKGVRFCDRCSRNVQLCSTKAELKECASKRECVCYSPQKHRPKQPAKEWVYNEDEMLGLLDIGAFLKNLPERDI